MANCPSCNAEIFPGNRWCPICHANLINPLIGRLASPGRRLGAYLLDVVIFGCLIGFSIVPVAGIIAHEELSDNQVIAVLICGMLFFAAVLWTLILFRNGLTPGKKILGIKVIKEDGGRAGFITMLIREVVGKSISSLIFSLGFLWILFDRENQGWHDKLMNTYVI